MPVNGDSVTSMMPLGRGCSKRAPMNLQYPKSSGTGVGTGAFSGGMFNCFCRLLINSVTL